MNKLKRSSTKRQLEGQLKALRSFPDSKLVRQLRRQLRVEIAKVERQIALEEKRRSPPISKRTKTAAANQARTKGMRKHHNYIRLIHDNYPGLSYNEIRKQYTRRKRRKGVSIPDVIWQNPSP